MATPATILAAATALLFPPTCVLCGAPGSAGYDLCPGCRAELPGIDPCCPRCALPFAPGQPPDQPCGRCLRRPPLFSRCRAVFRYEDPLPMLVGGLKFRARTELIRLLGQLMADAFAAPERDRPAPRMPFRPDAIVPVPLHPRRLRERGYNQTLELARILGRRLALPVDHRCCARVRATPPQAALDRRARAANIRGAFRASGALAGRRLVLLDDVVTTGSTVAELTRTLLAAGCAEIEVWTLARTP
ncbi:MAG: ComF family protein [Chromatiaceae bacterium]|nr:MAG: ComF family protein [Chromatiaceae bacterium]